MLEAIYKCKVRTRIDTATQQTICEIDPEPLPEGMKHQIVSYSKAAGYVLVSWTLGDDEESISGETLWQGTTPLTTGGGQLSLYVNNIPDAKRRTPLLSTNIWQQYSQGISLVASNVAIALRNNTIYI